MEGFVCGVCGHVEFDKAPEKCPVCKSPKTAFQEKMGHTPEPCRVPIVNLQTRQVKILKFGK